MTGFMTAPVVIVTGLPVQTQPLGTVGVHCGCAIKEAGSLETCVCFLVWNPPALRTCLVYRHYRSLGRDFNQKLFLKNPHICPTYFGAPLPLALGLNIHRHIRAGFDIWWPLIQILHLCLTGFVFVVRIKGGN